MQMIPSNYTSSLHFIASIPLSSTDTQQIARKSYCPIEFKLNLNCIDISLNIGKSPFSTINFCSMAAIHEGFLRTHIDLYREDTLLIDRQVLMHFHRFEGL